MAATVVLARSRLSGFSLLHRFSPQFRIVDNNRKSGSKVVPKNVFVHLNIKHVARYEFCIVFVSN